MTFDGKDSFADLSPRWRYGLALAGTVLGLAWVFDVARTWSDILQEVPQPWWVWALFGAKCLIPLAYFNWVRRLLTASASPRDRPVTALPESPVTYFRTGGLALMLAVLLPFARGHVGDMLYYMSFGVGAIALGARAEVQVNRRLREGSTGNAA